MTDSARVLLTTAALSGTALGVFAWRLAQLDPSHPGRLIGQLRLSQWTAVVLALTGGGWMGLGIAHESELAGLDVSLGVFYAVVAVVALHLEPRQSLLVLTAAFVSHALIDIAHRPGMLSAAVAPRWFIVGCAAYDVYIAALCFWTTRR